MAHRNSTLDAVWRGVHIPCMTNATDYRNRFEKRARTNKVRRICSAIRQANDYGWKGYQLAAFVLRLSAHQWADLAADAGYKTASNATRRRVVTALHVYREVA